MKGMNTVLVVLAVSLGSGCGDSTSTSPGKRTVGDRPVVCVVNYPLYYFAERIGGGRVVVELPAPADGDPAFWKPTADQIVRYQEADLILLNGATYAKWVAKASLPSRKLVDTSASFRDRWIATKAATTHSHGPGGQHAHAGTAFTTWIDFAQAAAQARAIRDALVRLAPDHRTRFESGFAALKKDIDDLDARMKRAAKPIGEAPLVASHPVYQYWARRYGLNVKALLWEPETVPDEAAMADLKKRLADHPAKVMIWEGKPASRSVELLAAAGLKSVVFAPCGNRPDTGDWLSTMRENIANLEAIARD